MATDPARSSHDLKLRLTRRALLGRSATGLGALALASLLNPKLLRADAPGLPTTAGSLPACTSPPRRSA